MQTREERETVVRRSKTNMILDASREVFSRMGYHSARLEDIADAAGFSKTALYYYFKDKEEIFLNLCLREHGRLLNEIIANTSNCDSFISSFEEIIRALFAVFGEHFPFMITMINSGPEKSINPADFLKYKKEIAEFRKFQDTMQQLFITKIENGKKSGEIASTLDNKMIANQLEALIKGVFQRWWQDGKMGEIENEITGITQFISSGLGIKYEIR